VVWFRTVFMNPFTSESDLQSILNEQVAIAEKKEMVDDYRTNGPHQLV
jgi:hypothetical protein